MQESQLQGVYVTLRFDAATERAVIDLWLALAEEGIELVGLSGHRPHITLSAYETEDVTSYVSRLEQFGRIVARFPITFGAVGVFPGNGVVFLAPVVTTALHAVHRSLLAHLADPGWPPLLHPALSADRWMPHCTLGAGADPGTVAQIVTFCTRQWQPIEGWIEGIGILVPPETVDRYDVSFVSHHAAQGW